MPDALETASGHRSTDRIGRLLAVSGFLAIGPGLYMIGAVVCFAQVAGVEPAMSPAAQGAAAGLVFCTTIGVYLLDRVKLRDRWLDPADAEADPRQYAFIARHARVLRVWVCVLLGLAAWLGPRLVVGGAAIPFVGAVGVLVYAGRPRRNTRRPKDMLLLKNAYVASGVTGLAGIVSIAAHQPHAGAAAAVRFAGVHGAGLAVSAAHLALRVFADAALCDLDDEHSDRRFGTTTLPGRMGRMPAWNAAMLLRIAVSSALLVVPTVPRAVGAAWAGVTVVSSMLLRGAAPARVRHWVDVRFVVEAAVVCAVIAYIA
ncbi:MAG TPA: hypothetical protein PL072_02695 [Phycisphaerales bacterium]|nr:hypothetical protein [Phycisphaerales bacterium]